MELHASGAAHLLQVLLLMDLHAHLSNAEIIGLLGGTWDAAGKHIHVAAAFPCRRAPDSLSGTSVELEPAAEVEARALIAARGLVPVGWYESSVACCFFRPHGWLFTQGPNPLQEPINIDQVAGRMC